MTVVKKETILQALRGVQDMESGKDIVSGGMVNGLTVQSDGTVVFMIEVDPVRGPKLEGLRQEAERIVAKVPGVKKVMAVLTAEKQQRKEPPDPHGMVKNPKLEIPAKAVIVVASGKGGVGKSTVAVNLATALANPARGSGMKVGLLDADIYGPSVPTMTGAVDYKPPLDAQRKLVPLSKYNMKIMSIGFMVEAGGALIWRGPMVQTALYQLLRDVDWAMKDEKGRVFDLDFLILDLPPGTGDIQLTLAQKVPVTGAVVVSTPQDIALIDARKAVVMFEKTKVPVLGIIENMSTYVCPQCGHEEHIFGDGGARKEAEFLDVPFMGAIPLERDIRLKADEGVPIVLSQPDSAAAKRYFEIAERLKGVPAQQS
ncbi:MAG: Mrp/NBP35 family ATP-binding protein [Alphaproteobacteria bacterium]|nr:Mrp/NBP35 family ATP-binding protein [Alphaproteobacteria bacterium]